MPTPTWLDTLLRAFMPQPAPTPIPCADGDGFILATHGDVKLTEFAGPRRSIRHSVYADVGSFGRVVSALVVERDDVPEVALNPESRIATARFEPTQEHGDVIQLRLGFHPALLAWSAMWQGRPVSQTALVELIDGFGAMTMPDTYPVILSELRKFKVTTGAEREVELSPSGFYAFRSTAQKVTVEGRIPTEMSVFMPMFHGLDDRPFTFPVNLRLNVAEDQKEATFTLSCPTYSLIEAEALAHAATVIGAALPEGVRVEIGELAYSTVPAKR